MFGLSKYDGWKKKHEQTPVFYVCTSHAKKKACVYNSTGLTKPTFLKIYLEVQKSFLKKKPSQINIKKKKPTYNIRA